MEDHEGRDPLEVERIVLEGKILSSFGPFNDSEKTYYTGQVRFENPLDPDHPVVREEFFLSEDEVKAGKVTADFYSYGDGIYSKFTFGAKFMPNGGLHSLIMETDNCDFMEIENFRVRGQD